MLELLVVILLIGVLAAIGIPSFLGQKTKAVDVQAKELARTAQTTAETIATSDGGNYTNVSPEELNKYEPSIRIAEKGSEPFVSAAKGSEAEYTVTVKANDGDEFIVSKGSNGEVVRKCVSPVSKHGCGGGEEASW